MKRRIFLGAGVALTALALGVPARPAGDITTESKTVSVGGRAFHVQVVRVPLASYQVKVGLAKGRVGATQPLAGMAAHYGAVAAINGCFFDAYTKDAIKPPWHHLFTDGQMVYYGDTGSVLAFDANGQYRMCRTKIKLAGEVGQPGDRKASWYAYRVNYPMKSRDSAIIYNRFWVQPKTPAGGTQVVVQEGKVTEVGAGPKSIPANGYVLAFVGSDQYLARRFQPGMECSYHKEVEQDAAFWNGVHEALGCGPRLVTQGEVTYNPTAEGFSAAKILSASGSRSMVGITRDGTLLLVASAGTVRQMADVMKALGAYDAMNLDGGASSCLWANGKYLVRPGRDISNALVIVRRK